MAETQLTKDQLDTFSEVCNIAFGAAANELTGRLKGQVKFAPPKIEEMENDEAKKQLVNQVVLHFLYSGDYSGDWLFFMDHETASGFAKGSLEGKEVDLKDKASAEEAKEAIKTAMAEIFTISQGMLKNNLYKEVKFELKDIVITDDGGYDIDIEKIFPQGVCKTKFKFKVADIVDSFLFGVVSKPFVKSTGNDFMAAMGVTMDGFDGGEEAGSQNPAEAQKLKKIIEYCKKIGDFAMIENLKGSISIRMAEKKVKLKEMWTVEQGTTLQFNKDIQEPVSVYFGKKEIAKAEVVLIKDKLGIKITEVNS